MNVQRVTRIRVASNVSGVVIKTDPKKTNDASRCDVLPIVLNYQKRSAMEFAVCSNNCLDNCLDKD